MSNYSSDVFDFNNSLEEINKIQSQDIYCDPCILDVLVKASSQSTEILKPAAELLKKWETESGFYISLLNIFVTPNVDINARWLAIVCCKNGIEKYWRKSATCAINQQERKLFKQRILTNIREPIPQLAVQMAVVIAKIARYDCPNDWPELFPQLLTGVKSPDNVCQDCSLLIFNHVIKALSSKRLAGDRFSFNQLVFRLLPHILEIWEAHIAIINQTTEVTQAAASLERAYLCLKILRKFDITLNSKMTREKMSEIKELVHMVFSQIKHFLFYRQKVLINEQLRTLTEKYIIVLCKFVRDILELHPENFIDFIVPAFENIVGPCFAPDLKDLLFEKFVVFAFNIFKSILITEEYQVPKCLDFLNSRQQNTLSVAQKADAVKNMNIMPHVEQIVTILITKYFLLTPEDLRQWNEDPEQFAALEEGDSWSFSLRPSTQKLFVSLLKNYRTTIVPLIINMLTSVSSFTENASLEQILLKEAICNACGLSAFDMYDQIEFDNWLVNTLIPESKFTNENFKYLKRRIIWLMGQWVGIKVSKENHICVYKVCLEMLDPQYDLMIRLAAAKTLGSTVDDFDFEIEIFIPFLQPAIIGLFQLIDSVQECDTKLSILSSFNLLLQRVNVCIRPYASMMIKYIPDLWQSAQEHNMFQAAILVSLTYLLESLGSVGHSFHEFVISVIKIATNINSPYIVYLLEDALILWRALVNNSPSGSPQLLELVKCIFDALEYNLENLRLSFQILQNNFILMPTEFMQVYGKMSLEACLSLYSDLKSEGQIIILKFVDCVLKIFPEEGANLFLPLILIITHDLLNKDKNVDFFYPIGLETSVMAILSKILITSWDLFSKVIEAFVAKYNCEGKEVFEKLVQLMARNVCWASPLEKKKLLAMGLCNLIPEIIGFNVNINDLLYAIVDALHDLMEPFGQEYCDVLVCSKRDEEPLDDEATEHDTRIQAISKYDPVNIVVLKDLYNFKIQEWKKKIGEEAFLQIAGSLNTANLDTLKEMGHFG